MMNDKNESIVNANNEFTAYGIEFIIPSDNKSYKVFKKYDEVEDYENESRMDRIKSVVGEDLVVRFFDENNEEVNGVKINSLKK